MTDLKYLQLTNAIVSFLNICGVLRKEYKCKGSIRLASEIVKTTFQNYAKKIKYK